MKLALWGVLFVVVLGLLCASAVFAIEPEFLEDFSGDLSAWNLWHASTSYNIEIIETDGNPPPSLLLDDMLNNGCYAVSKRTFSYVGRSIEFSTDMKHGDAVFADQRYACLSLSKHNVHTEYGQFGGLSIRASSHPTPNVVYCNLLYEDNGTEIWEGSGALPIPNGDGWHNAKIKIRGDRKVEFYLDGQLLYTSTHEITSKYDGQAAVEIGVRRSLYDNVTVNEAYIPAIISGKATDSSTGEGISGATVSTGGYSTSTDSQGDYSLSVPEGTYTVTASADGYSSQTRENITVTAGATTTLDFSLEPIAATEFVLYLPMDEGSGSTIYDQSGNGNNGTIYGASWATGVSGSALEFDGVDDYAEVHENTNLDGFDDFSVSIWIKPTADLNSSTGRQDFYYKGPPVQWVTSLALNYDDVDGQLQFNLHDQDDWFSYASVRYETEFNAGQWYHIAVTYDGLSEVIMYVNGAPQGVDVGGDHGTISGLVVDNLYDLRLGARTDDKYYFNGAIDELRIYGRRLTGQEVLALYEEFAPSENQPPIAFFTYSPEISVVGEKITFDASSSTDPDGKIDSYEWDWDNDGLYDKSTKKETASHFWNAEGTYPVGLRVTDRDGAQGVTSEQITIVSSVSILEKYAPVLYFHSEEQFYPWGIESMLNKAELWIETEIIKIAPTRTKVCDSVSPDDLHDFQSDPKPKDPSEDPYYYYLNLKGYTPYINIPTEQDWEGDSFKIYGRYYDPDDRSDKIVLQYWFFYPFNVWDNGTLIDWNQHEGDWEMMQIILDRATKTPIQGKNKMALHTSVHNSGNSYEWSAIQLLEGTSHPKIFVAKGSHGGWHEACPEGFGVIDYLPKEIKHFLKSYGLFKDLTSETGRVLYYQNLAPPTGESYPYLLEDISHEPSWIMWKGWWGDREPQFFPIGTKGSQGPPSPGTQGKKWEDPIKWSNGLTSWTVGNQAVESMGTRTSESSTSILFQNYPNPFNPETTIEYSLAEGCDATLKIYNMAGKLIKTLVDDRQTAGNYSVIWYGDTDTGGEVASGVYFCQINAGDFVSTKKMVVLK